SAATRVGRAPGAAVRLLPERRPDGRGGAARAHAPPEPRRDRRGDRQRLPLRHLSATARGDPRRSHRDGVKRRTLLLSGIGAAGASVVQPRSLLLSVIGAAGAVVVGWALLPPRERLGGVDALPVAAGEVALN